MSYVIKRHRERVKRFPNYFSAPPKAHPLLSQPLLIATLMRMLKTVSADRCSSGQMKPFQCLLMIEQQEAGEGGTTKI